MKCETCEFDRNKLKENGRKTRSISERMGIDDGIKKVIQVVQRRKKSLIFFFFFLWHIIPPKRKFLLGNKG